MFRCVNSCCSKAGCNGAKHSLNGQQRLIFPSHSGTRVRGHVPKSYTTPSNKPKSRDVIIRVTNASHLRRLSKSMSDTILPWICPYLIGVAQQYGAFPKDAPLTDKGKKVQVIKVSEDDSLTLASSADNVQSVLDLWGGISRISDMG